MIERIYLKDAVKMLECSPKTFRKLCANNDVGILHDHGSKKPYVLKAELESALDNEPIKYLKKKYGEDKFPMVLKAYMSIHSELMATLEERNQQAKTKYKPSGNNEKRLLNSLTKYLSE